MQRQKEDSNGNSSGRHGAGFRGQDQFHEWIGDGWAVLFSHPKDYTPVCTTELGAVAKLKGEFDKRNVKVVGFSVDELKDHEGWSKDIEETQGMKLNFPLIDDHETPWRIDISRPSRRRRASRSRPSTLAFASSRSSNSSSRPSRGRRGTPSG